MAIPSRQYLDGIEALNGAPKITYPFGGQTHPRVEFVHEVPKDRVGYQPTDLSAEGGALSFPNCYLVELAELVRSSTKVKIYRRYETLPGPELKSDYYVRPGVWRRVIRRQVAAGTLPSGGSPVTSSAVEATSAVLSMEVIETFIDATGTPIAPPIFTTAEIDWANLSIVLTKRQKVDFGASNPEPGSEDGTSYIWGRNSVSGITVTAPGTGYTSFPSVNIGPPAAGGVQAVAEVTALGVRKATVVAAGSGYNIEQTVHLSGGTFSVAAQFAITSGKLYAMAPATAGTGYAINDVITLKGGTTKNFRTFNNYLLKGAGRGEGYEIDDELTLTAEGALVDTVVKVTHVNETGAIRIVSIVTAGLWLDLPDTPATLTVVSTTSVNGEGAIVLGTGDVSIPGRATVKVTRLALVSVVLSAAGADYDAGDTITLTTDGTFTGSCVLTVDSVNGSGAIQTFHVSSPGSWSAIGTNVSQLSTSGIGTGATFGTRTFGVGTVTVESPGSYSALPGAFTQHSTTGAGTGATFDSITVIPNGVTLVTAGSYSVLPTTPVATTTGGGGSGLTLAPAFGVVSVNVTTPGSGYTGKTPAVSFSGGGGSGAAAKADTSSPSWVTATAYIVGATIENSETGSTKVWRCRPIPPSQTRYRPCPYCFPGSLSILRAAFTTERPSPGFDFVLTRGTRGTFPARETWDYQLNPIDAPIEVFALKTPGAGSNILPIPDNTSHPGFTWFRQNSEGEITYAETFADSSPPYFAGDTIIVGWDQEQIEGPLWKSILLELREGTPLPL